MKIDIDFELLQQTQLSADDFLYLYIIYRKGFNYLTTLNLKPNLDELQSKGYITLGETADQHVIRQEFINLFSNNFDQMFAELVNVYPMKVNSLRSGVRILHAKNPDAKANEKAKNKYSKIIGTKAYKHKHILNCLNKQLIIEKDNLGFLQNLEVWINNHTWEKYENLEENDTREITTRITRSL